MIMGIEMFIEFMFINLETRMQNMNGQNHCSVSSMITILFTCQDTFDMLTIPPRGMSGVRV